MTKSISLVELTDTQVIGVNRAVIKRFNSDHPGSGQIHQIRDSGGLNSCVSNIFYQSLNGYQHLPIEKMAGLLLYRIAEGQYFVDGNKRTAYISCRYFLGNNGYWIDPPHKEAEDLLWGFATPANNPAVGARYDESDSIKFIENNIFVRT